MALVIPQNLFDLTPEQEETSKIIYNGKIVKCLVAPYHTFPTLESVIPYTKTTYLLPEREVSIPQLKQLVTIIANSNSTEEFRIITANQNIIMDMVDDCVRVLTERGEIVDCPIKTFMANIHDIRYKLLENEDHQISKNERSQAHEKITQLINLVESKPTVTKEEKERIMLEIDMIGEDIIRTRLREMAIDLITIKS